MKKIILVMLALILSLGMMTVAMAEASGSAQLEGVIAEIRQDGSFLMDSISMGQVLVQTNEETALEGVEALAAGQYVFVEYDGTMTKSVPPQATAQKVSCYVFEGTVQSVDEAAGTALVESEEYSLVQVKLPVMETALHEGDYVAVYFGGAMAMSYPAQAGGLKVDVYAKASGTVAEIGDGYFTMDTQSGTIRVNIGEETVLPEALEAGDEVTVLYNGQAGAEGQTEIMGLIIE
jgi:hydrogenase maturation factor